LRRVRGSAYDLNAAENGPCDAILLSAHTVAELVSMLTSILEAVSGLVAAPRLGRAPVLDVTKLRRRVAGVP
jgi:hypothetical protein